MLAATSPETLMKNSTRVGERRRREGRDCQSIDSELAMIDG